MADEQKLRMVGFRASKSLRDRIEAERTASRTSTQEILRVAVECLLALRAKGVDPSSVELPSPEEQDRLKLLSLWQSYITEMPAEKVELMARVMELDLKNYRSSRIVQAQKHGLGKETDAKKS